MGGFGDCSELKPDAGDGKSRPAKFKARIGFISRLRNPLRVRYCAGVKRYLLLILLAVTVVVVATGCKSHSGSREFIPGQGWQKN
jgi:hypothetical protein